MIRTLLAATVAVAFALSAPAAPTSASETKPGVKLNRLAGEASPYLRQHADNPIDWYPWGQEAFARARAEGKPIFLSVGYSTCHWCHVMERESYSDAEIAKLINRSFIAIKVDRERRPDVDETYMLASQIINQTGGWPNNVFMTPDLKPFFGGTYFPPDVFKDLLGQVAERWLLDRAPLIREADRVAALVHRIMTYRVAAKDIGPEALNGVVKTIMARFDAGKGGFAPAPKFPQESLLLFMLDQAETTGNKVVLEAVLKTIDAMIHGGIRDQVGGGFHRYTIDSDWRAPHFEIMLYNQAGIARALLQAHRITGQRKYAAATRSLLDFVLRDMTAPRGGFYAAFDADSRTPDGKSVEGAFYTWNKADLKAALEPGDAALATRFFGVTDEGSFEGRNVLHMPRTVAAAAAAEKVDPAVLHTRLGAIREKLRVYRRTRNAPHRDDKILTAWNGLMITALAEAAATLGEPRYRDAALKAANFFWTGMGGADGALKRYHFEAKSELIATQPDHAFLALGYLALYDTTQDEVWRTRAIALAKKMDELFLDTKTNDYFMTARGGFYRPKIMSDTDLPSGNAAALELYARLSRRDLDPDHRANAEKILASISGTALASPNENTYALRVANQFLRGETGPVQMIASGRVRAQATADPSNGTITVHLNIAPGWHVNAHKPLEDYFIPTVVNFIGGTAPAIAYPRPRIQKLGFHDQDLALYEGDVEIVAKASGTDGPRIAELTVQACSDKLCLDPETVRLSVLPRSNRSQ